MWRIPRSEKNHCESWKKISLATFNWKPGIYKIFHHGFFCHNEHAYLICCGYPMSKVLISSDFSLSKLKDVCEVCDKSPDALDVLKTSWRVITKSTIWGENLARYANWVFVPIASATYHGERISLSSSPHCVVSVDHMTHIFWAPSWTMYWGMKSLNWYCWRDSQKNSFMSGLAQACRHKTIKKQRNFIRS